MTVLALGTFDDFTLMAADALGGVDPPADDHRNGRLVDKLVHDHIHGVWITLCGDSSFGQSIAYFVDWVVDYDLPRLDYQSPELAADLAVAASMAWVAGKNYESGGYGPQATTIYFGSADGVFAWDFSLSALGGRLAAAARLGANFGPYLDPDCLDRLAQGAPIWEVDPQGPRFLPPGTLFINYGGSESKVEVSLTRDTAFNAAVAAILDLHRKRQQAGDATLQYDFNGRFSGVLLLHSGQTAFIAPYRSLSERIYGAAGRKNNWFVIENTRPWTPTWGTVPQEVATAEEKD